METTVTFVASEEWTQEVLQNIIYEHKITDNSGMIVAHESFTAS